MMWNEEDGRIRLRPTTPEDLPAVLEAERHPDNAPFIRQWSEAEHRASLTDPDRRHWCVEAGADHHFAGYLILVGLQNADRDIMMQRLVITEKGKGYGRACLKLMLRHAFTDLNAHRIHLSVRAHNLKARTLYASVGFHQEGLMRNVVQVEGKWQSIVQMAILHEEYDAPNPLDGKPLNFRDAQLGYEVRRMIESDVPEVARAFRRYAEEMRDTTHDPYYNFSSVDETRLLDKMQNALANPTCFVMVATVLGRLIGFCSGVVRPCFLPISEVDRVGYIEAAWVESTHRGRGLMRQMEAEMMSCFRESGLRFAELHSLTANPLARQCWETLGYRTFREQMRKSIPGK